jgi:tetratricopeptide (TPR) repeat protein
MADGVRLMAARDFAAAATAFEAALAAKPDDARALAELSWAQFSAGDFAAAEETAVKASSATSDRPVLAMALYNQGRALEALDRPTEAQEAYTSSLALRDNREVRSRRAPASNRPA